MNAIFLRCGRLLARFHFWVPAVLAFSKVQPLTLWDNETKARFAYACMMGRTSPLVRRLFTELLKRELDSSMEMNLWLAKVAWALGRMNLAALIYQRRRVAFSDSTQKKVAECQRRFATGLLDQSIARQLAIAISNLGLPSRDNGPIIIVPISVRYFDLFELWSEQLESNMKGHCFLLALDTDTAFRLRQRENTSILDLSDFFVFHEGGVIDRYTRSNLWILRVLVLCELAARGYTLLSLDLDALVIGDLPGLIGSLPQCDIVAQEDYSIPMDVARRLGFILCCGFMLIRSNPATNTFLNRYVRQTILEMDDQLALNHLLLESGIAHGVRNNRYMQFNAAGISWVCPDKSFISRDIRYGSVIRHFQQIGETIEDLRQAIHSSSPPA